MAIAEVAVTARQRGKAARMIGARVGTIPVRCAGLFQFASSGNRAAAQLIYQALPFRIARHMPADWRYFTTVIHSIPVIQPAIKRQPGQHRYYSYNMRLSSDQPMS